MRVIIQENYDKACRWTADHIAKSIRTHKRAGEVYPFFVLGLPTGSTPIGVYDELVRMNQEETLSFDHVITFNMDEYLGLAGEDPNSYRYFMQKHLFDRLTDLPPENIHMLDGRTEDPAAECSEYEACIASCGGIDLFLGGVGTDGHLAFNEPFTSFSSRTGIRTLTTETRLSNSRFFGNDPEKVPNKALSVGVGTVMDAKEVLLLVSGQQKARALAQLVEGEISQKWICSILQLHDNTVIVCDEEACSELKVCTYRYFRALEAQERL